MSKLLRRFRRLFTPRENKAEPKDAAAPAADAAADGLNKGFAALNVDEASAQQEPEEDISWEPCTHAPKEHERVRIDRARYGVVVEGSDEGALVSVDDVVGLVGAHRESIALARLGRCAGPARGVAAGAGRRRDILLRHCFRCLGARRGTYASGPTPRRASRYASARVEGRP